MDKQQTLHFKKTIIALSIIALGCAAFNFISIFIIYRGIFIWSYALEVTIEIIRFAPFVLFVIYLLKFHKEGKATFLVPTIFGLISLLPICFEINYFLRVFGASTLYWPMRGGALFFVVFALATISALKGFSKKIFLIIAATIGSLFQAWSLITFISYIHLYSHYGYLYSFMWPIVIFGSIALYVALLLFGLKNRIPTILSASPEKEKKKIENMNPEQALKRLNKDLKLGLFTEEEYQALRADIISKL